MVSASRTTHVNPSPLLAPQQHQWCNSCLVQCLLEVALGHDIILNGTMCIWKILNGKLLQKLVRVQGVIIRSLGGSDKGECCGLAAQWNCSGPLQTHACAHTPTTPQTGAVVTCTRFLPDGTKILMGGHNSICQEFRLLPLQILKEFCGHKSCMNCCSYVVLPPPVSGTSGGGGGANSCSCSLWDDGGGRRCLSRASTGRRWRRGNYR
jgi:hypothetical protein